MSEPMPASVGRCESCKHWRPPSERTDFRSPIDVEWQSSREAYATYKRRQDQADMLLGECDGIPMHPTLTELPSPPAAVIDGSDYFARVYTGADFYCALWEVIA